MQIFDCSVKFWLFNPEVGDAFGVCEKSVANEDEINNHSISVFENESSTPTMQTTNRSSKKTSDEHNESCDVCDTGGDLLCCDTCSLVFHLKCIRPKLTNIPKGDWSCPQCILDVWFQILQSFLWLVFRRVCFQASWMLQRRPCAPWTACHAVLLVTMSPTEGDSANKSRRILTLSFNLARNLQFDS